ncbi:hypothetical protein QCA50_008219 [Cerrena zonata]|uniref:Uncharacterized protein n=1 Tax=Cerrena zonata TaxID=2478898 RepID=A0AAW0GGT2_9APHY
MLSSPTFPSLLCLLTLFCLSVSAYPSIPVPPKFTLEKRTDPFFPDEPASCPICAQSYPSINSCAQAAPVLSNFSMIIFNPGAFIDVIKCACTDTFQTFPQCADCFIKTNQSDVLNTPDLPGVVSGMRQICALESTLLGNVSVTDGEVNGSSTVATPTPTATTNDALHIVGMSSSVKVVVSGVMGLLLACSLGVL